MARIHAMETWCKGCAIQNDTVQHAKGEPIPTSENLRVFGILTHSTRDITPPKRPSRIFHECVSGTHTHTERSSTIRLLYYCFRAICKQPNEFLLDKSFLETIFIAQFYFAENFPFLRWKRNEVGTCIVCGCAVIAYHFVRGQLDVQCTCRWNPHFTKSTVASQRILFRNENNFNL